MPESQRPHENRQTYLARFEEGPRDGTLTAVLALESGEPPEVLLTPGRRNEVYVLAGGPRRDGSLPYLHMPPSKAALLRHSRPQAVRLSR